MKPKIVILILALLFSLVFLTACEEIDELKASAEEINSSVADMKDEYEQKIKKLEADYTAEKEAREQACAEIVEELASLTSTYEAEVAELEAKDAEIADNLAFYRHRTMKKSRSSNRQTPTTPPRLRR